MTSVVPSSPSLAPCSPPSSTLRAACGGGLRPCLTAAVHEMPARTQAGTKKPPASAEPRNTLITASGRISHPASPPARSKRQRRHKGQDPDRDTPLRHRASQRAAMLGTRSAQPIGASGQPTASTGRIHDRSRPRTDNGICFLHNGGRPYMTKGGRNDNVPMTRGRCLGQAAL